MWLRLKDVRSNWDAGWVSWLGLPDRGTTRTSFGTFGASARNFWNVGLLNARLQYGRPVQEGYRLAAKDTHDQ